MTDQDAEATREVADWNGKRILVRIGEKIGRFHDVDADEPRFATAKEGFIDRHLTFVPVAGIRVSPDARQVSVTKGLVRPAPDLDLHFEELSQADE